MKRLIHFLASLRFALFLIFTAATVVIVGTVIEAKTESHTYAAKLIYGHPLFALLLLLFFVNILFSALKRWPFQTKHFPFLMTHLGLLMIIGGTLIKGQHGVQGHLNLVEGSGSHLLIVPHTESLMVKSRDFSQEQLPLLDVLELGPEMRIQVKERWPHAELLHEGWISQGALRLIGYPPIPIGEQTKLQSNDTSFYAAALNSDDPDPKERPLLTVRLGEHDTQLLTFISPSEERIERLFDPRTIEQTIVYDGGFGGYALEEDFHYASVSPEEREEKGWKSLQEQIADLPLNPETLSPPLSELLQLSQTRGQEFSIVLIDYLQRWKKSGHLLFPASEGHPTVDHLSWDKVTATRLYWVSKMLRDLEPHLEQGKDLIALLSERGWPLVDQLRIEDTSIPKVTLLAQQVDAATHLLPPPEEDLSPSHLFSAYCILYGITPEEVWNSIDWDQVPLKRTTLHIESPLHPRINPLVPSSKLEENCPAVLLTLSKGGVTDELPLIYDGTATGPYYPALDGLLALRFQPKVSRLPHHVRLHRARRVTYPGTDRPYSYEADVSIQSTGSSRIEEVMLAMNQVYETEDGTRFYLAGMGSEHEGLAKRVTLVVNRDPAKYWLTYPGACVMALGIFCLFFLGSKKKRS